MIAPLVFQELRGQKIFQMKICLLPVFASPFVFLLPVADFTSPEKTFFDQISDVLLVIAMLIIVFKLCALSTYLN